MSKRAFATMRSTRLRSCVPANPDYSGLRSQTALLRRMRMSARYSLRGRTPNFLSYFDLVPEVYRSEN